MENNTLNLGAKDHPGVYVPPPLLYVVVFIVSVFLQKLIPIDRSLFETQTARVIGWSFAGVHAVFVLSAFWRFFASGNSLLPIRPARSLETKGVYSVSRNPMYLGLLLLYLGMAIFKGNWWTYVLAPIVVLIIERYVIRKEEQYLKRAFGEDFEAYCKKVRRWI